VVINFNNTGNTLLLQGVTTTVQRLQRWPGATSGWYITGARLRLLATNLRNFSAVKNDKIIQLQCCRQ